jgi:hypothetical protein
MIERRLFPRYPVELQAEVWSADDSPCVATCINLGRGGVELETGRNAVEALAQTGSILNAGDSFRMRLQLGRSGEGRGELVVDCRATYVRRLSQDSYCLGVRFATIVDGEGRLGAYLAWCAGSG